MCVCYFISAELKKEKTNIFPLGSRGKASNLIDSGQVDCYHLGVPQLAGKVSLILYVYIGSQWAYYSPDLEENIFFP